ncbi:MAG: SixA phosphatase family protein [Candidatus Wenzhouxiangella sp. M2_3B_020]
MNNQRLFCRARAFLARSFVLFALTAGAGCTIASEKAGGAETAPADRSTLVILVRHAEKSAEPAGDPVLTDAGRRRAERLADLLAEAGVTAIYATEYERTQATGRPIAERLGLEVRVRPVGDLGIETHSRAMAREILAAHAGESVLIVGHSNTVPVLVDAFTGLRVAPIADDEYDRIFIATTRLPGSGRVIEAAYPAER